MELTLYNTLTRRKEVFRPLVPGQVGIYTCGPTVYADAHIGNLRSYVFPDVLRRTLQCLGYRVTQVVNITDVGHLTSDADTGEDKLERAAATQGRSAWELAQIYEKRFLIDLQRLGITLPDVLPRATEHIPEQIALIQRLEQQGFAYRTADGIYFDTERFPTYGALALLDRAGLQEGHRVAMGHKRHKTDFALWKFSPPEARRQMEWDSPWGRGFPGWHIECSAMSMKVLGETFDIHTGGKDHIPVHHTNEIAQSEAATGKPFVRYWLHGEFLVLGEDTRMGKSAGNFLRLQEVVERGVEPLAYRYLVLNSHYRKFLHFSWEALHAADTALMGLRRLVQGLAQELGGPDAAPPVPLPGAAQTPPQTPPQTPLQAALLADLCDDLNTPKALATLWTALKQNDLSPQDKWAGACYAEGLLHLGLFDTERLAQAQPQAPPEVLALAEQRWQARLAKNWAESDRLRDLIQAQGYEVKDGKDSYQVQKA